MVRFFKYSGCGNDFVLIDKRESAVEVSSSTVSLMCDRHRGIGADGVIFLERSQRADYKMRIYNADGSEAEMCGNGLRCLARFIHDSGDHRPHFCIETMERILNARVFDDEVEIEMGAITELLLQQEVVIEGEVFQFSLLNTGVPHLILFVEEINRFDLAQWGPLLRRPSSFAPCGANVNVVQLNGENNILVRTYERGVEAETLACGTGATAAAIASHLLHGVVSPVEVEIKSGEKLKIKFESEAGVPKNISLSGPATSLFDGHFRINSIK